MEEEVAVWSSRLGIQYATDYVATYTERSLVDKVYVDGEISMALLLQKLEHDEYNSYNQRVMEFAYER